MMKRISIAAMFVAACAGDPTPTTSRTVGGSPVAANNFNAALAAATCQLYVRCGTFQFQDECVAFMLNRWEDNTWIGSDEAAGTLTWDADAAGACFAKIATAACTEIPSVEVLQGSATDLRSTIDDRNVRTALALCAPPDRDGCYVDQTLFSTGTVPDGATCTDGAECSDPDSYCTPADGSLHDPPLVCSKVVCAQTPALVAPGHVCDVDAFEPCVSGFTCTPSHGSTDSDWTCTPTPSLGDSCAGLGNQQCATIGQQCAGMEVCMPFVDRGGSCEYAACKADSICDEVTYVCEPPPTLGQPCSTGDGETVGCAPGLACQSSGGASTCQTWTPS